ncbi:MAG: matrixin family metalloprotease [Bryobacteraceae bacterium]
MRQVCAGILSVFLAGISAPSASGYAFGYAVGDMRLGADLSGGTACPQMTRLNLFVAGGMRRQWSTELGTNPSTIITQDKTASGMLNEIEATITQSVGIWTGVSGTTLTPSVMGPLTRTSSQNACSASDGENSICFDQNDPAFTTGVLAFTRVTTADSIGEQPALNHPPAAFVGEILDADVLLRPGDPTAVFATPGALAGNPQAYDLESVLTHEIGHSLGFEHSDVWRAMMFPFVQPAGQFLGSRPTTQAPDASLSDDDRTGLRVLYPDPADTTHIGVIRGRILPANTISLAGQAGVTGIFASQVVAVDAASGVVIAATRGGWTCSDPGPPLFDGSYSVERLPVGAGRAYEIYVEPFTGPEDASDVSATLARICRNAASDPGWPGTFACTVPTVNVNFGVRIRPPDE